MKKTLLPFAALLAAMVSCTETPQPPTVETADFLDVYVSFGHERISPEEGMTIHAQMFESEVTGIAAEDLKPAQSLTYTLEAQDIASTICMTFENVDPAASAPLYVLGWLDVDGSGSLTEGDLAMWYKSSVEKVASKEAAPVNCRGEYSIDLTISAEYGEKEFIVPEGMAADFDRNLYTEVVIGPQIWLKENLRATHYQDGTAIAVAASEGDFGAATPMCVNPYSDEESPATFGLLYNWYVVEGKNPCPEGYRVPSDEDFLKLEAFVAPAATDLGEAGNVPEKNSFRGASAGLGTMLKSSEYDFGGTDDFGFCGVPGGLYDGGSGFSQGVGEGTLTLAIWTSDSFSDAKAVRRLIRGNQKGAGRGADNKVRGHSLRCMKDNPDYEEAVPDSKSVSDIDGNEYEIVTIGTQTWMKEHLRVTKFNDGTDIPKLSGTDFQGASAAAYANPYSSDELVKEYGLLYNWYAVATEGKNPCPSGWHVPSDAEFLVLEGYLAPTATLTGNEKEDGGNVWRGKDEGLGTMLKYDAADFGGSADSQFAAKPGGTYGKEISKGYDSGKAICVLWVTDSYASDNAYAWRRMLQYNNTGSGRGTAKKVAGQNIRCVKDAE